MSIASQRLNGFAPDTVMSNSFVRIGVCFLLKLKPVESGYFDNSMTRFLKKGQIHCCRNLFILDVHVVIGLRNVAE